MYRGVSSRGEYSPDESNRVSICLPSNHAPDKIRNSVFLPLMKKALIGHRGRNAKTSLSLVLIKYMFPPPLLCYATDKIFLLRQKMESNEKTWIHL